MGTQPRSSLASPLACPLRCCRGEPSQRAGTPGPCGLPAVCSLVLGRSPFQPAAGEPVFWIQSFHRYFQKPVCLLGKRPRSPCPRPQWHSHVPLVQGRRFIQRDGAAEGRGQRAGEVPGPPPSRSRGLLEGRAPVSGLQLRARRPVPGGQCRWATADTRGALASTARPPRPTSAGAGKRSPRRAEARPSPHMVTAGFYFLSMSPFQMHSVKSVRHTGQSRYLWPQAGHGVPGTDRSGDWRFVPPPPPPRHPVRAQCCRPRPLRPLSRLPPTASPFSA